MEKLADGMQNLQEDDMLHIVQMVYDNKTAETYTKNDVESMFPPLSMQSHANVRRWRVQRRPLHAP